MIYKRHGSQHDGAKLMKGSRSIIDNKEKKYILACFLSFEKTSNKHKIVIITKKQNKIRKFIIFLRNSQYTS